MPIRALRGAIDVGENSRQAILDAATVLLRSLIDANDIVPQAVISAIFTATSDLNRAYPAEAARRLGWIEAALICVQEMDVVNSMPMCLRVAVLWETDRPQSEMRHRYLGKTEALRPDLRGV